MIMRHVATALAALLLLPANTPAETTTLIRGARVFDGTGAPAKIRDVLVRNGRIANVAAHIRAPAGARVVDGTGQTLLPGLHDLHIHTRAAQATAPDALTADYAAYLRHGVTSVNEFSVSGEMLSDIRGMARSATVPHLRLAIRFGVPHGHGTESDFTNGITTQVSTPEEARAGMRRALALKPDLIKIFADGWRYGDPARPDRPSMDLPTLKAIVTSAHRAGIPVVTHTVTLEGAKHAARAGVDAVAHGIGDALVDDEMIALMKRHNMAYIPTLVVYEPQQDRTFLPGEWRLLGPRDRAREERRRAAPPEAIPPYDSKRWVIMRENIRRLKAAGIPIGVGTDSGIGGVYHGSAALREIRWLTMLGFTPAEALKAATSVSARIIWHHRDHGRIARGQRADLVLVGGRPDERIEDIYDIRRVFVSGREAALPAPGAEADQSSSDER